MLSDLIDKYDDKRVYMIQRCLPPLQTVAGETGELDVEYTAFTWTKFHGFGVLNDPPYAAEETDIQEAKNMAGWSPTADDNHPLGSLWAFHIDNGSDRWCVLYRVAASPLKKCTLPFAFLGLEPGNYLAFDFWPQKFLGCFRDKIKLNPLPLGSCQVIALRKAIDRPQLISSSRHVGQDAVSVTGQDWLQDRQLVLQLNGVPETKEIYWISMPDGFTVSSVEGQGVSAKIRRKVKRPNVLAVGIEVYFGQKNGRLTIKC